MENLLLTINILQKAYNGWLVQRLVPRMIMIAGLVIVIAIMVSATFIGGLYIIYYSLLSSGIEQLIAMLIAGIAAIFIILLLLFIVFLCLKRLHLMPKQLIKQSSFASGTSDVLNAFTDGFMAD